MVHSRRNSENNDGVSPSMPEVHASSSPPQSSNPAPRGSVTSTTLLAPPQRRVHFMEERHESINEETAAS